MKQHVTIKTPGKLMVAGEFAVLERNYSLIVMAVNKYVETTVQSSNTNHVTLIDFDMHNLAWEYNDGLVQFLTKDRRLSFIQDAMQTVITYLAENDIEVLPFSLTVKSELDDHTSGLKYGLGSSAAVVASVIHAVMEKFAPEIATRDRLFKLAAISHVKTQGNGSGADIAASIYGGVLAYTSFQAEWLLKNINFAESLTTLVDGDWKYLSIESVQFPNKLHICVGWTGSPAETKTLVDDILQLRKTNPTAYTSFLANSGRAVQRLLHAMETNNVQLFLEGIKLNRNTLVALGLHANVQLETEKLALVSDIAEKLSGAGKFSGAGGGDCGLAFLRDMEDCHTIYNEWKQLGIVPLALTICQQGSHRVKDA